VILGSLTCEIIGVFKLLPLTVFRHQY